MAESIMVAVWMVSVVLTAIAEFIVLINWSGDE